MNDSSSVAPSGIFELIAFNVSKNAAWALSPPVAAVISATGLSGKAVDEETVQSNAFFNAPGTPNAYSGITKKTPSASDNNFINAATVSGVSSLSSNAGISARPL